MSDAERQDERSSSSGPRAESSGWPPPAPRRAHVDAANRLTSSVKSSWVRPLVAWYHQIGDRETIDADLERWAVVREISAGSVDELLTILLTNFPEFRNLFYYRLEGLGGKAALSVKAARRIWHPMPMLDLACDRIGPGLVITHGFATILAAKSIGRNCWVHHEVTIGWTYPDGWPTIGDDVFVGVGAKILGGVHIGDGAKIGANAVVVKDVPAGATAIGVPARIVGSA